MKAITIRQPWASLVLIGAKPFEFRAWRPSRSIIGQRIAIHASARKVKLWEISWLLHRVQDTSEVFPCLHREIAEPALEKMLVDPGILPQSHVLCTAVLGEPKRGDECAREFGRAFGNDSDRAGTFDWGWPLTEIEPVVPPERARGQQRFWTWKRDG